MFYFQLGIRTLRKNRRRTMLTVATIALGTACLLVSKGYSNYCLWGLRESIINGGVGHFQIFAEGRGINAAGDPFDYLIPDYKKTVREISAVPGIACIAPRLSFTGLLSSGAGSAPVVGYGGWIEEEKKLMSFSTIEQGSFMKPGEPYGALIGGGVAEALDTAAGNSATLSAALQDGSVNAVDITTVGIVRNQLEEMENVFACLPMETVQTLLDADQAIDSIILLMIDAAAMEAAQEPLKKICAERGLEYRTWDEIVPYYSGANDFYSSAMNIALIVIVAVVLFAIANTMLMSVYERMREFGTIRSLGADAPHIFKMMSAESLLLALFGCAAGIAAALLCAWMINSMGGIPLPPPPGNSKAYRGLIFIEAIDAAAYSAAIAAVSVASSWMPAAKAVRMSIADSLRWV